MDALLAEVSIIVLVRNIGYHGIAQRRRAEGVARCAVGCPVRGGKRVDVQSCNKHMHMHMHMHMHTRTCTRV